MASIKNRWINVFGALILGHDIYGWNDFGKIIDVLTEMKIFSTCTIFYLKKLSRFFFVSKLLIMQINHNLPLSFTV